LEETPSKHKKGIQSMNEMTPDKLTPDKSPGDSGAKPKKMDSNKEIELSCSPVKRGRRGMMAESNQADSPYQNN